MKGLFYRSYNRFPMYPVTIHCSGMKYKGATVLSAGFALFGLEDSGVSAYVTLENGNAETAKELLSILDETMNFPVLRHGESCCLRE